MRSTLQFLRYQLESCNHSQQTTYSHKQTSRWALPSTRLLCQHDEAIVPSLLPQSQPCYDLSVSFRIRAAQICQMPPSLPNQL
jgi:hypothetical protein